MEKLIKLLEDSSVKLLTVEPDDLAILAELHTSFEDMIKAVEELELIDSEQQIISDTSQKAADLVQDIVLQDVEDPRKAIESVSMTVKSLQEMINRVEKGESINNSSLESAAPSAKSVKTGTESSGTIESESVTPITIELPENVDEDIFAEFVSSLPHTLDNLETAILEGEQDTSDDNRNSIKGILHNLKGESSLMTLQQMANICHDAESLLEDPSNEFPGQKLLETCDQLRKIAAALRGESEETIYDERTDSQVQAEIENAFEDIDLDSELLNSAEQAEETQATQEPIQEPEPEPENQSETKIEAQTEPEPKPAQEHQEQFESLIIAETDIPLVIDFVNESREHLENAENDMLAVEDNPEDQEAINSIFRAFHTIKGVAGFLDLKHIGSLAHVSETLLDMGRKGETILENAKVDVIFEAIDIMKRMLSDLSDAVAANEAVHPVEGLTALINRIQMCIEGKEFVPKVGEILREKGEIKRNDLNAALKEQRDEPNDEKKKIGEILVENKKTTGVKVEKAIQEQKNRKLQLEAQGKIEPRKLGEILIDGGFVKPAEIDEAVKYQHTPEGKGKKIGEILLEKGIISREKIELAMSTQIDTAQSAQKAKTTAKKATTESTVKVTTERLDALINMVGELVIAQAMVSRDLGEHRKTNQRLERNTRHLEKITRDLQELSMSTRMVPVQGVFQKMARLVRDLSRKSGKQIEFEMAGAETELDRNVVEEIADPLVHMVRNSVDHGVESPAEREAAGKSPSGKIELKAYHKGGNIVIEISDDGKGLNREKLLKKAVENGIVKEDAEMSDQEVYRLIFHAGFSTAEKITDISGRGVGMDVVRKNIESLRGRIDIDSTLGKGTIFRIQLPLTLAVIEGQEVTVGDENYIIPTASIEQNLRPVPKQISTVQGGKGEMMMVRGELIPLVRLYKLYNLKPKFTNPCESLVVIVTDGVQKCCIQVDDLLGQQQVVIKSLGQYLGSIKGISGGAIMGDGNVSLILDVPGLLTLANEQ